MFCLVKFHYQRVQQLGGYRPRDRNREFKKIYFWFLATFIFNLFNVHNS
jgi:hypothetical protein